MRYLILSDIHSNLEALERCLELAHGKYDQALCLGDLVGYGPDPNAVIDRMRSVSQVVIRGNHDKACSGLVDASEFNVLARLATEWTRGQLTAAHLEYLRALPPGPAAVDGFELVHGSPLDEDEYLLGPLEALSSLRAMTGPLVFFGHTHYQGGFLLAAKVRFQSISFAPIRDSRLKPFPLAEGDQYLINPGSVGQPRDGDWRAAFAILDQERKRVEYFRTPYDLPRTQAKMRDAGLPDHLIRRLEVGR